MTWRLSILSEKADLLSVGEISLSCLQRRKNVGGSEGHRSKHVRSTSNRRRFSGTAAGPVQGMALQVDQLYQRLPEKMVRPSEWAPIVLSVCLFWLSLLALVPV